MGPRNLIMVPCNMNRGWWNVNREPWNVYRGPWNVIMKTVM